MPSAMKDSHVPLIAAASVIAGGALLSWAVGMMPGGIFIMTVAGFAAILAIYAGTPTPEADDRATELLNAPATNRLPRLHSHPEFVDLFNALPDPLLIADQGRICAANAAALNLLGDFIIGADVRTAIRHPAAADILVATDSEPIPLEADLVGIGRAGQRWQMQTRPLPSGAMLIMLQDLTAQDAVERMRADFVANASHELRTPLAVILGTLETLHDPAAAADAAVRERFLASGETEARRMLRLVEDLLSISRIEASKGVQPSDPVDLAALCRTVVAELAVASDLAAGSITIDGPAQMLVPGDRAQLSQLVHNLVSNAIKYAGDAGPVTITLQPVSDTMVEMTVADRGEGIAAEHLPRLTERFYRVDTARSRAKGGTGLGLAIAKHIVQRHQGRLEIDSTVGEGTSVRVRLPALLPVATASEAGA